MGKHTAFKEIGQNNKTGRNSSKNLKPNPPKPSETRPEFDSESLEAAQIEEDNTVFEKKCDNPDNDEAIVQSHSGTLVQQLDGVISWEIMDAHRPDGTIKQGFFLKNSPPRLVLKKPDEDVCVDLFLTKTFTNSLYLELYKINKMYGCLPVPEKKPPLTFKKLFHNTYMWVTTHTVSATITGLGGLLILFLSVTSWL